MWVLLTRHRKQWLLVALPLAGWLVARLLRAGEVPAGFPRRSPLPRRASEPSPHPVAVTGHVPVSSPHAREIAAHNKRVIDDYRGRHASPGSGAHPGA